METSDSGHEETVFQLHDKIWEFLQNMQDEEMHEELSPLVDEINQVIRAEGMENLSLLQRKRVTLSSSYNLINELVMRISNSKYYERILHATISGEVYHAAAQRIKKFYNELHKTRINVLKEVEKTIITTPINAVATAEKGQQRRSGTDENFVGPPDSSVPTPSARPDDMVGRLSAGVRTPSVRFLSPYIAVDQANASQISIPVRMLIPETPASAPSAHSNLFVPAPPADTDTPTRGGTGQRPAVIMSDDIRGRQGGPTFPDPIELEPIPNTAQNDDMPIIAPDLSYALPHPDTVRPSQIVKSGVSTGAARTSSAPETLASPESGMSRPKTEPERESIAAVALDAQDKSTTSGLLLVDTPGVARTSSAPEPITSPENEFFRPQTEKERASIAAMALDALDKSRITGQLSDTPVIQCLPESPAAVNSDLHNVPIPGIKQAVDISEERSGGQAAARRQAQAILVHAPPSPGPDTPDSDLLNLPDLTTSQLPASTRKRRALPGNLIIDQETQIQDYQAQFRNWRPNKNLGSVLQKLFLKNLLQPSKVQQLFSNPAMSLFHPGSNRVFGNLYKRHLLVEKRQPVQSPVSMVASRVANVAPSQAPAVADLDPLAATAAAVTSTAPQQQPDKNTVAQPSALTSADIPEDPDRFLQQQNIPYGTTIQAVTVDLTGDVQQAPDITSLDPLLPRPHGNQPGGDIIPPMLMDFAIEAQQVILDAPVPPRGGEMRETLVTMPSEILQPVPIDIEIDYEKRRILETRPPPTADENTVARALTSADMPVDPDIFLQQQNVPLADIPTGTTIQPVPMDLIGDVQQAPDITAVEAHQVICDVPLPPSGGEMQETLVTMPGDVLKPVLMDIEIDYVQRRILETRHPPTADDQLPQQELQISMDITRAIPVGIQTPPVADVTAAAAPNQTNEEPTGMCEEEQATVRKIPGIRIMDTNNPQDSSTLQRPSSVQPFQLPREEFSNVGHVHMLLLQQWPTKPIVLMSNLVDAQGIKAERASVLSCLAKLNAHWKVRFVEKDGTFGFRQFPNATVEF